VGKESLESSVFHSFGDILLEKQSVSLKAMTERTVAIDTLRITELLSSDIPDVVAIEQSSNPEPWTRESFLEELLRPHSHLLVARVPAGIGTTVAGYLCFWLVADEVQILNLAVHQAYRRQGIGRALLVHCLNFGSREKTRKAILEVRSSNSAAQRLYQSLGFRAVGARAGYYGGMGEHAILMELIMGGQRVLGGNKRWSQLPQAVLTDRS
jgi:[ribosomal protein S18]-alanine N-acetyltransferase